MQLACKKIVTTEARIIDALNVILDHFDPNRLLVATTGISHSWAVSGHHGCSQFSLNSSSESGSCGGQRLALWDLKIVDNLGELKITIRPDGKIATFDFLDAASEFGDGAGSVADLHDKAKTRTLNTLNDIIAQISEERGRRDAQQHLAAMSCLLIPPLSS